MTQSSTIASIAALGGMARVGSTAPFFRVDAEFDDQKTTGHSSGVLSIIRRFQRLMDSPGTNDRGPGGEDGIGHIRALRLSANGGIA